MANVGNQNEVETDPASVRIAVLSPNPQALLDLMGRLSIAGTRVVPVRLSSAIELFERRKEELFDMALIDELLLSTPPGRSLAAMQTTAPGMPLVVLSHSANESAALEYIRLGVDEVLFHTDLNAADLSRAIGRALQRSISSKSLITEMSNAVIMSSSEGVVAFDLQGRILLWNPTMERMLQTPRQNVLGKVASEAVSFYATEEAQLVNQALSGRAVVGKDRQYSCDTGQRLNFNSFYAPLRNTAARVVGAVGIIRDTSGRTVAERLILESQQRLSSLANANPGMVWIANDLGERIFFNSRWLAFTGRTLEQELGTGWMQSLHTQDVNRFKHLYEESIHRRQNFHIEFRLRRADGSFRRILDSGTALFLSDGSFCGFVGVSTDVGETRMTNVRMTAARPASHDSFNANATNTGQQITLHGGTLDNSPIGVWKLDCNLVVTKANAAVGLQMGVEPAALLGRKFTEIVTSLTDEKFAPIFNSDERIRLDNHPITFDGATTRNIFWDIMAWPFKDVGQKETIGVCLTTMDSTDRQRIVQAREDFVATLVHDLKTPLIGADRTLDCMLNGALGTLDGSQAQVLEMLKRSNHQLLTMVQNLIEVYRYEGGVPKLALEEVSIADIASTCVKELAALAADRGVMLTIQTAPYTDLVSADRLSIRRVLLNLIDNALKFTPQGGRVEVSVAEIDDFAVLQVSDNGIGLSPQDQARIFERFWQSERGKKHAVGTGLGLYLCQQIVTAHGGKIGVSSKENAGTTFTLLLPIIRKTVTSSAEVTILQ